MTLILGSILFSISVLSTSSIRLSHFSKNSFDSSFYRLFNTPLRLSSFSFSLLLHRLVSNISVFLLLSTKSSQIKATRPPSSLIPFIATFDIPVQVVFKCVLGPLATHWKTRSVELMFLQVLQWDYLKGKCKELLCNYTEQPTRE